MDKKEYWKDIPDFEGFYQASNLGRIKSLSRQYIGSMGRICLLKERIMKGGRVGNAKKGNNRYLKCILSKDGVKHSKYIHQLIIEAWSGKYDKNIYEINHIDGDKTNNRVENLEIVIPTQNLIHAMETGLIKKYADHQDSKRIRQLDKHGRFIAEYCNCYIAGKILGIDGGGIRKAADKNITNYSMAAGYIWEYV